MKQVRGGTKTKRRGTNGITKMFPAVQKRQTETSSQVKPAEPREKKLYALDTNVLMTKSDVMFNLDEHSVFIPWRVLLELDGNKKGIDIRSINARQAIDILVRLVESVSVEELGNGIPLIRPGEPKSKGNQKGRLFFSVPKKGELKEFLDPHQPDQQILIECLERIEKMKEERFSKKTQRPLSPLVVITKDKVMRILARLVGIKAEDYRDDAINIESMRSTGVHEFSTKFWEKQTNLQCEKREDGTYYTLRGQEFEKVIVNEFVSIQTAKGSPPLILRVVKRLGSHQVLAKETVDYTKRFVFGIKAWNQEQNIALNALMDPEIDVVIIEGSAGSGKNILALAAACQQIIFDKRYEKITATREAIPVGRELGFKPGNEREKMEHWMGGMLDNLKELYTIHNSLKKHGNVELPKFDDLLELKEMSSIRGSSVHNTFLILDENQNSNREQQKLFLTRPAKGSKTVCLGNFTQTDLIMTDRTSGLARVIDAIRMHAEEEGLQAVHIVMPKVERGRVAGFFEKYL